ncbi:hypothetical protein AB0C74_04260 [Spirillospora sp. NPDC048832]
MPELTPFEKELLANPDPVRGHVPRDGAGEPAEAPEGPAAASPPNQAPTASGGSANPAGPAQGPT